MDLDPAQFVGPLSEERFEDILNAFMQLDDVFLGTDFAADGLLMDMELPELPNVLSISQTSAATGSGLQLGVPVQHNYQTQNSSQAGEPGNPATDSHSQPLQQEGISHDIAGGNAVVEQRVLASSGPPGRGGLGQVQAFSTGLMSQPVGPGTLIFQGLPAAEEAEALLAGLDLEAVFAPIKTSRAKRIRGHVRALGELQLQLQEKVRSIQSLAAENKRLRQRARMLELVVACRQEQLNLLQSYRASTARAAHSLPAALVTGNMLLMASTSGHGSASNSCSAQSPPLTSSSSSSGDSSNTTGSDTCTSGSGIKITYTPPDGAPTLVPRELDAADLEKWSPARLVHEYRAIVAEASAALVAAEQLGSDQMAHDKVRAVMTAFSAAMRYLRLVNSNTSECCEAPLAPEASLEGAPPGHYMGVVQALRMSPQQMMDMASLFELVAGWMTRINRERAALSGALSALLDMPRYGSVYREQPQVQQNPQPPPPPPALPHAASDTLPFLSQPTPEQLAQDIATLRGLSEAQVIERLHANVVRERCLYQLVDEVVFTKVLDHMQYARVIVHSYPYIYDILEILKVVHQVMVQAQQQQHNGMMGRRSSGEPMPGGITGAVGSATAVAAGVLAATGAGMASTMAMPALMSAPATH